MRLEHIIAIARCLEEASIRYLVVGGMAVNAYGFVRYTNDLDLVINLETANIRGGLEALQRLGYRPKIPVTASEFADRQLRESWIKEKGMVVLNLWSDQHRETPIDVFVSEPFDFNSEWTDATRFPLAEGIALPIIALGSLLRMKQNAGRPQDLADIEELKLIERIRHET